MGRGGISARSANEVALAAAGRRGTTLATYGQTLEQMIAQTTDPLGRNNLQDLKVDVDRARDAVRREEGLRRGIDDAYKASTEKSPDSDPLVKARRAELAELQKEKFSGSCVKSGNVNDAVIKCIARRLRSLKPRWTRYGKKGGGPAYRMTGEHSLASYAGWDAKVKSGIATDSQRRVMAGMSANEGGFDDVQAYDNQTLTAGAMQKTIDPNGRGELAKQLSDFKADHPDDYERLFGDRGWAVDGEPPTARFRTPEGDELTGSALRDYIKTPDDPARWEAAMAPFRDAGRDPAWQGQQVDDFLTRLDDAVDQRPAGYQHPISNYITSERGAALVLDHSVNRPGHVRGDVGRALNDFYAHHPDAPNDPRQWTESQRAQYEPEILQRYVPYRANHSSLPMTDNQRRADAIIGNASLRPEPGVFQRPGDP